MSVLCMEISKLGENIHNPLMAGARYIDFCDDRLPYALCTLEN